MFMKMATFRINTAEILLANTNAALTKHILNGV